MNLVSLAQEFAPGPVRNLPRLESGCSAVQTETSYELLCLELPICICKESLNIRFLKNQFLIFSPA
jgi:hypothetical protein